MVTADWEIKQICQKSPASFTEYKLPQVWLIFVFLFSITNEIQLLFLNQDDGKDIHKLHKYSSCPAFLNNKCYYETPSTSFLNKTNKKTYAKFHIF